MDQQTQKIIDILKQELEQKQLLKTISKLMLFGSRARGDHHERSDLDVVIEMKKMDKTVWHKILEVTEELPTLLKIDVIDYTTASDTLKKKIQQEGIIIYEQN